MLRNILSRWLAVLFLLLISLNQFSPAVFAYAGEDIDKTDEDASTAQVTLEMYGDRIHAFSRVSQFRVVNLKGQEIAIASARNNPGFIGWVLDFSTKQKFEVLVGNTKVVDVKSYWPKSTIGWTWVTNNNLLLLDFPVYKSEVQTWLYSSKLFTFACSPSGIADARALAEQFLNPYPAGSIQKYLGLHSYLRSSYPTLKC